MTDLLDLALRSAAPIKLRDYQIETEAALFEFWRAGGGNPLAELATGTGKSIVIADLIRRLHIAKPERRFLILAHVRELIEQNVRALLAVWPAAAPLIGISSAGLGRREPDMPIVFGTIQTCYRNPQALGVRNLAVVDEAHLLSRNSESMYQVLLSALRGLYPPMRVAGLTATPYRTDSGRLDQGEGRLFDRVVFSYGLRKASPMSDGETWIPVRSIDFFHHDKKDGNGPPSLRIEYRTIAGDYREWLPLETPDAPWLPEMTAYNAVLGKSRDRLPPARNIEHQAACPREKKLPTMHAFRDAKANAANGATSSEPPAQWVIAPLSEHETAEMLERHIDFVDENGRSVHCPAPFVKHYMKRDDNALPTIAAIATLPIVLGDGHIFVADGLERSHGIVFIVKPELMKLIPERAACTKEAIGDAMRFLTDEWLVDVATTDANGKAILVALALTIIERSLLPDRPAFFITSGKRGSGKTTAIKMIMEGVTGTPAAAAAWSTNDEERRKALLAYFMYGVPYILWDNIARGTVISCPHIEESCTSAYYSDRKLGVSEMVATAAATIHVFTGNNIAPKGDIASRSLQVRLDANRIDPENREFKHPDPLGWTRANRNRILAALYIILLGNPKLDQAPDAPMKTRYKMWQRIVGSAVEHAAWCALQTDPRIDHIPDNPDLPDFGTLFLSQEAEEEEATSLADALLALDGSCCGKGYCWAKDVMDLINTRGATEAAVTIRAFLFPTLPHDAPVTAKAVGRRLKAHVGEPVKHGGKMLVLRSEWDTHNNVWKFSVKTI
jgi:hypothetical protein